MIYCPKCNTANRDHSKFCNECGADLRGASIRCRMCGDMNPPDRVVCAHCGARLVMQVDAEPVELPAEDAPVMAADSAVAPITVTNSEPSAPPAGAPADTSRPTSAAPPPAADEMPAWLRELRATPPSEPSPSAEPLATAEREPVPPAAPAEPSWTATPTAADEFPEWLRELQQSQSDAGSSAGEPRTPKLPFKIPFISSRPTSTPKEPPLAEAPVARPPNIQPPEIIETPAWLAALQKPEPSATVESQPLMELPASEPPDWLADLREIAPSASAEAAQMLPLADVSDTTRPPAMPAAELPSAELPDWLRGLAPTPRSDQPVDWTMKDVSVEDLPDWLKPGAGMAPSAARRASAQAALPAMDAAGVAGLAPGEIPSWLQALRPSSLETLSGETIETSGLLAGIRGALPVESVLTQPHKDEPAEPTPAAVPVAGFAELFAPQPPPQTFTNPLVRSANFKVPWFVLLVIAFFALAALPFLPFFSDLRGANITIHQPSSDFYQAVNALRPNQLVMVAMDYAGGSSAELNPQARAALLHLLQNKQHVVTLSFVADGTQLAQDLLNGLDPAKTGFTYPYNYGDTHINLGYQSSGEAALRSLVQNPTVIFCKDCNNNNRPLSNWPIAKEMKALNDFALLIVFSDDGAQVERWIKQVAQPSGRPMVAGVSAAAAPLARPYYASKQIVGLLEGVRGACEYELSLARPTSACAGLDALSYVAILLAVIIVITIVAALFSQRRHAPAT